MGRFACWSLPYLAACLPFAIFSFALCGGVGLLRPGSGGIPADTRGVREGVARAGAEKHGTNTGKLFFLCVFVHSILI